ncbi:hypothetical protein [Lacticaseibacillus jixiensis]|uniref:hypothetical protein n=1 Tax=Lacticaseibacillus jixiensis TaxID=3231926 RepID=UPI0036F247D6
MAVTERMHVSYKNKRIEKQCTSLREAKKAYSEKVAVKLLQRVNFLVAADNLASVIDNPVLHFHDLKGNREGIYAIDIDGRRGSYRLLIRIDGFSKEEVFAIANVIEIIEITEVSNHYE